MGEKTELPEQHSIVAFFSFLRKYWRRYTIGIIAAEVSSLTRYYDACLQFQPRPEDDGLLLSLVEAPIKEQLNSSLELASKRSVVESRISMLLNGNLNYCLDAEGYLREIVENISRSTRLIVILYNPYLHWIYLLANVLGLRKGEQITTFLTYVNLEAILKLVGLEIVRSRSLVFCPFSFFGIGNLINRLLPSIPIIRRIGLVEEIILRSIVQEKSLPSLSIVIPARNERGNIGKVLERMPEMPGTDFEIIFVEGHSSDGTWEEIQTLASKYKPIFAIKTFQQTGIGKCDAVRLGFSESSKDLLTILDADLTMPPEMLPRFYAAYCKGYGDFINGNRLVYPIEGKAMCFLNRMGNVFFAKALSAVLGIRIGDSLCGTKLFSRSDYQRFCKWREDFGDFDPFGDFELLFPAAELALGLIDLPIRYADRTYGDQY